MRRIDAAATQLSVARLDGPRWPLATLLAGAGSAGCLALMRFVDRPLAEHFRPHSGPIFQLAAWLTTLGEAGWWLIPSLAIYLGARLVWRSPLLAGRALFVFAAVAGSGLLVDLIKPLLGRARPTLLFSKHVYGFSYLHLAASYESFPSGHTACAMGAGVALGLLAPRYRPFWIALGLLVGFTRVIVTAHYLSDVVASVLLSLWMVLWLERLFASHGVVVCPSARCPARMLRSQLAKRLLGHADAGARPFSGPP